MQVNSRFFLDYGDIIGLFFIYSIIFFLIIAIVKSIFDEIKKRIKRHKHMKIMNSIKEKYAIKEARQKEHFLWEINFRRQFAEVINF